MIWLRENPFVAGLVLVLAAGGGALAFLLSGAIGNYSATLENYNSAVQRLQQLQNKTPFPDPANLKAAEEQRDQYRARLGELRAQLAALQKSVNPSITPQQFSDELRASFNDITKRAEAAKVKLPENFYLGFNEYSNTLPSPEAAPALARELDLILQILGILLGNNPDNPMIQSLDSFIRTPLAVEKPAPAAAPTGGPRRPNDQDKPASPIQKMPLSIGFTTEQGKFRVLLNNLLQFPQFLIIRTLAIENSKLVGPPVETSSPEPASQPTINELFAQPAPENKRPSLNVLLGRESLKITLQIELVDFAFPASPATP